MRLKGKRFGIWVVIAFIVRLAVCDQAIAHTGPKKVIAGSEEILRLESTRILIKVYANGQLRFVGRRRPPKKRIVLWSKVDLRRLKEIIGRLSELRDDRCSGSTPWAVVTFRAADGSTRRAQLYAGCPEWLSQTESDLHDVLDLKGLTSTLIE